MRDGLLQHEDLDTVKSASEKGLFNGERELQPESLEKTGHEASTAFCFEADRPKDGDKYDVGAEIAFGIVQSPDLMARAPPMKNFVADGCPIAVCLQFRGWSVPTRGSPAFGLTTAFDTAIPRLAGRHPCRPSSIAQHRRHAVGMKCSGSPNSTESTWACLRKRPMSNSSVMPMPPCICRHSAVTAHAVSLALALAIATSNAAELARASIDCSA